MAFEVKAIAGLDVDTPSEWPIARSSFKREEQPRRTSEGVAEDIKAYYEHVASLGGSVVGSHVMLVTQGNRADPKVVRSDLYFVAEIPKQTAE